MQPEFAAICHDICGNFVHAFTLYKVLASVHRNDFHVPKYLCFSNAHTTVTAAYNTRFRDAVNHAWMNLPSGQPLAVLGNILYRHAMFHRIFGADFMAACLHRSEELDLTHFFYGSTSSTLERLVKKYQPVCGNRILGWLAPPFGNISTDTITAHFDLINSLRPKIIWIALGAPRQEIFMHENLKLLRYGMMAGVGAAFAFESGDISRAPQWMQECGMQWFWRLMHDPTRLWKRYLVTNPAFIGLVLHAITKRLIYLSMHRDMVAK